MKAVLFDWDNTLISSWDNLYAAICHVFSHFDKVPPTMAEVKQNSHYSLRDSFPKVFGNKTEEAGKVFLDFYSQHHIANMKVIDGAEETVKMLYEKGIYMAVLSNKTGKLLREGINHLGWQQYFSEIVGSGDAKRDKPDRAGADMILRAGNIDIARDEVWYVGDTIIDMQLAHIIGAKAVLYGCDSNIASLAPYHPDLHVEDHKGLQQLIRKYL